MLEGLGLDAEQEAVYRELLSRPRCRVDDLSSRSRPADRVRSVLNGLVDLGIAVAVDPDTYAAIAPDVAISGLARARADEVRRSEQAVAELMATFWAARRADPVDFFELVADKQTLMERWFQVQRAAKHEVRAFDCPPYLADPVEPDPVEMEQLGQGVEYRVLYTNDVLRLPGRWADLEAGITAGEQARVSRELPAKLTLFDDVVAVLPVRPDDSAQPTAAVVVHRSPVLDALSALFEAYWERAAPIVIDAEGVPAAGPVRRTSVDEQRLVALLAAGLGDKAIQRALGVSASTVQRRVHDLMARLGVTSRFQAGLMIGRANGESSRHASLRKD